MAGRLAPASDVAGSEDMPYHFKKGSLPILKRYGMSSSDIGKIILKVILDQIKFIAKKTI
jgi:hypothetical protein